MKFTLALLAIIGAAATLSAQSPAPCPPQEPTAERPNIVMIAIDDLNNWVGPWQAKAITPNIDRLAKEGVGFRNAYCVVPACNPSRVALMTGMRPETTGQYQNAGNFRDKKPGNKNILTIAQYLSAAGYESVAAGKIFHHPRGTDPKPTPLSDPVSWNFQNANQTGTGGADEYLDDDGYPLWYGGKSKRGLLGTNSYAATGLFWGPIKDKIEDTGDWKTADFGVEYLAKKHDKPFFLALGIFRPHSPQLAPQKFFDMYPLDKIELPNCPEDDMNDIPKIAQTNWSTPMIELLKSKPEEYKKAIQAYLACITYADACIGHILDGLAKSKYADNTIVIMWSDHGWQLGHKNRWEKFSLWKQGTNAPFIIKLPNGLKAVMCDRAVSYLDIYPTICELTNLPKPTNLEGTSLLPLLKDPKAPREIPAIITYPEGAFSIVLDQWNYIRYEDGSEELYDHNTDNDEFHNLADKPEFAAKKAELAKWIPSFTPSPPAVEVEKEFKPQGGKNKKKSEDA